MSIEQFVLLCAAVGVAYASRRIPRAVLWIVLMGASFIASTAYARGGGEMPEAIAAITDITIVLGIIWLGKERWEDFIGYIFLGSAIFNILELVQIGWTHWAYIVFLEACNWAALLVIGLTAFQARRSDNGYENADSPNANIWGDALLGSLRRQSAHKRKA